MKKGTIILLIIIGIIFVGGIVYFTTDLNKFPFGKDNKNQEPRGNFNPENMDRQSGNFTPGGFQIDDSTKEEIILFFNSNPSDEEIENYCGENKMYCEYYCMQVNPEHEYCKNMQMPNFSKIK